MTLDIRIMGSPRRADLIADMLRQLQTDETIVTYDDRPAGGDAMYTARKCWLTPLPAGTTHRLVLQDDLDLCDDFTGIMEWSAAAFPDAFFSLYSARLRPEHRRTASPYIILPGAACYGQAILMPVPQITRCFDWINAVFDPDYRHDDCAIGEFARRHHITMMSTIPSTVQHRAPTASLLRFNNPRKVSKVWIGHDLRAEDWRDLNASTGPHHSNNLYLKPDQLQQFQTQMRRINGQATAAD